jgi:hypothetical protein
MNDETLDLLIEQAASAFRERDGLGRIKPSPAWADLPQDARETLFQAQIESRIIERALDPAGLSGTARAVLARLRRL